MQWKRRDKIHLSETVTLFKSISNSKAKDRTASDFEMQIIISQKLKKLVNKGKYNEGVTRYIPKVLNLMFQGMIENMTTSEPPTNSP